MSTAHTTSIPFRLVRKANEGRWVTTPASSPAGRACTRPTTSPRTTSLIVSVQVSLSLTVQLSHSLPVQVSYSLVERSWRSAWGDR